MAAPRARGPTVLAAFLAAVTAAGVGLLAASIVVIATIAAVRLWILGWLDRST